MRSFILFIFFAAAFFQSSAQAADVTVSSVSPPSAFTEISFAAGSSTLDPFARQSLDQVIRDANARGAIDEVRVVSWGDASAISRQQTELAKNRNRAVEDFLGSRGNGLSIKSYNMAEKPSALQDLLNNSDDRMRYSLAASGVSAGITKNSKALVIVLLQTN